APAPTHNYTLSLHDALPISQTCGGGIGRRATSCGRRGSAGCGRGPWGRDNSAKSREHRADFCSLLPALFCCCLSQLCTRIRKERSEEHTSELQSRFDLVCRL